MTAADDSKRMSNLILGVLTAVLAAGAIAAFSTWATVQRLDGGMSLMLEAIKTNSANIDKIDKEQRERSPRVYGVELQIQNVNTRINEMNSTMQRIAERLDVMPPK